MEVGTMISRATLTAAIAVLLAFSATPAQATAADLDSSAYHFSFWLDQPKLIDSHEWILLGKKLSNGACRYSYATDEDAGVRLGTPKCSYRYRQMRKAHGRRHSARLESRIKR
jgi:hypothetical protein